MSGSRVFLQVLILHKQRCVFYLHEPRGQQQPCEVRQPQELQEPLENPPRDAQGGVAGVSGQGWVVLVSPFQPRRFFGCLQAECPCWCESCQPQAAPRNANLKFKLVLGPEVAPASCHLSWFHRQRCWLAASIHSLELIRSLFQLPL